MTARLLLMRAARERSTAIRRANRVIEYLRPMAVGDTQKGITPNAEALAISTLAHAQVAIVLERARAIRAASAR